MKIYHWKSPINLHVTINCRSSRNDTNCQHKLDATGGFGFGKKYGTRIGSFGPRPTPHAQFSSYQSGCPQMDRAFTYSITKFSNYYYSLSSFNGWLLVESCLLFFKELR